MGYYYRYPKTDLGRIFEKKYAEKHFCERKSPNQGTHIGTVIASRPEQCATTAKTSEWKRAGNKNRGAGGHPPRLFASGLSLAKAWIPRPGPGGNPRRRSGPAAVLTGPPPAGNDGPRPASAGLPLPPGLDSPRQVSYTTPQKTFAWIFPDETNSYPFRHTALSAVWRFLSAGAPRHLPPRR